MVNHRFHVQAAWKKIGYPHAFASSPRDPIKFLSRFKMEEFANLLWVGHILAENGPVGFQTLWKLFRPAAAHYIYGFNSSGDACKEAASSLLKYAITIEKLIIFKMVCPTSGRYFFIENAFHDIPC